MKLALTKIGLNKKYLSVICFLLFQVITFAQDYEITFTGIGESTSLDSVLVQNISQNTQITIDGEDILHLVGVLTNVIDPSLNQKNILIYPNPMSESAFLEFYINEKTKTGIEIFDVSGKLIVNLKQNTEVGKHVFEIKGLSAGIYSIRLSANDWQSTARLISSGNSHNPSIKYVGISSISTKEIVIREKTQNLIQMQYNNGELLVITAYSGVHANISTLIPTASQQVQKHIVTCIDPNDNSYATVTIGEQVWMAENLKYDNGCSEVSSVNNTDNGWCGFQTEPSPENTEYGFYYQWSAALNICPDGWKLPSDEDWKTLELSLGMSEYMIELYNERGVSEGSKLAGKSEFWNQGDLIANDNFYRSGFTALPAGHAMPSAESNLFLNASDEGLFWSSTSNGAFAVTRGLDAQSSQISRVELEKYYACNVRCLKDTIIDNLLPDVLTSQPASITHTSVHLGGNVTNEGSALVTNKGIVFSTGINPTIENNAGIRFNGSGIGSFNNTINNLVAGNNYYFRAFAINEFGTAYGEEISFQTIGLLPPTVATLSLNQYAQNSVSITAYCLDNGGSAITSRGVVFSTEPNPTIEQNSGIINQGAGLGQFICQISDLEPDNTYYFKAFATNSVGTSYGQELNLDTSVETQLPSVSTISASAIYHFYAEINSEVNNQGSDTILERGIVLSTLTNPTLENNQGAFTNGYGVGSYTITVATLSPLTTYFVRAYATNSMGTSYGNEISFQTPDVMDALPCPDLPLFTDLRDTSVYHTVQIGFQCWMAENLRYLPFVSNTNESHYDYQRCYVYGYSGNDLNVAKSNVNYQKFGVLYNKMAAFNGEIPNEENPTELKGNCPYGWHLPSNNEWTQLKDYLIGNEYNYDNTITENKIAKSMAAKTEWNTSSNVGAVGNNLLLNNRSGFTALPGGQKSQYSSYSGVNLLSIWWSGEGEPNVWGNSWFLDYAAKDLKTYSSVSAGEALSVRCVRDIPKQTYLPVINTKYVTGVSQFAASSGGIIIDDGNSEITSSGLVWSTSQMPAIDINEGISNNIYGLNNFSNTMQGLLPHTIYYVRAYVINSVGVAYGDEKSFQTLSLPSVPSVETIGTSSIGIITAKSGVNIINNFGYPIISAGIVWSSNPNPSLENNVGITNDGAEIGVYESTLVGLLPSTQYYVRAYANNIGGVAYGEELTFITKEACADTLYDFRDSTTYNVIQIGNQCWMKENLRYLPEVFPVNNNSATVPKYYVYDYSGTSVIAAKSTVNYSTFGVLYNWEAAKFACPGAWHLSSHNDWVELERSICQSEDCEAEFTYEDVSGTFGEFEGSMMIMDTSLWTISTITNNEFVGVSEFDALPAGWKYLTSSYSSIGTYTQFWLSTNYNTSYALARYLSNTNTTINRAYRNKEYANSVRCVKDE